MPAKSKSTSARKSRTTKKTKTTAPAPTPAPEPVVEVVAAPVEVAAPEPVATPTEPSLDDQFKDILTRLQNFRTLSQTLMADVRKLQKNVARQVRESSKKNKKRRAALNVKPSDEVTYFNLQRYMKPHFPQSAANLAAGASA